MKHAYYINLQRLRKANACSRGKEVWKKVFGEANVELTKAAIQAYVEEAGSYNGLADWRWLYNILGGYMAQIVNRSVHGYAEFHEVRTNNYIAGFCNSSGRANPKIIYDAFVKLIECAEKLGWEPPK